MKLTTNILFALLCIICGGTYQQTSATVDDFSQRFGPNSHITNIPIWFKLRRARDIHRYKNRPCRENVAPFKKCS